MKVAIQGIPGSFHHQVALIYFGKEAQIEGFRTFEEVAKAIAFGDIEHGIMAIENSIAGAILPNYELIDRYDLYIKDEFYLPISHNLLCLPGQEIADIQEVRSHPMALLQCKKFFSQYPHMTLVDDVDTASVAKRIAENKIKSVGAVAAKTAAEIYGLQVLEEDIQTVKENFTRFIILQKEVVNTIEEAKKASLKFTIPHEKGSLAKLLILLGDYGLNLTKIQSMPLQENPWHYAFFVDTLIADYSEFLKALEAVKEAGNEVKILGTYPSNHSTLTK